MSSCDLETIEYPLDGELRRCPQLSFISGRWVTCKHRGCPRCGVRWARAWSLVTRENLDAYGGAVAMVTITAPGADLLPWACTRDHKHGGPKGCRVVDDAADTWASRAPANWRRLRDAARAVCARADLKPTLLQRVWEPQKRGVPHLHIVLGLGSDAERAAARLFVDELARLAPEYLFGFVDRRLDEIAADDVAKYLAGYLLGRRPKKASIRENIADARMPRSLLWMTPRLTALTKVTVRRLRQARWVIAAANGVAGVLPALWGADVADVARVCVALERVRVCRAARGPTDEAELEAAASAHRFYIGLIRAMRPKRHPACAAALV
jgi:hypothetical protein